MVQHILVASDLSIRSERALRRAFRLAEGLDAKLTVLSVVDEDLPMAMARNLRREARQSLAELCATISQHEHAIEVDIGDPSRDILKRLESEGADLLVLGVHRPRGFLFAGSTMERIVRNSEGPVLLVNDAVVHDYQKVLAGIDMSPSCAAALQAAARLAPDAKFETFHAVHVPFRGFLLPQDSAAAEAPLLAEARRALDAWWQATALPANCPKPVPVAAGRRELLSRKIAEFAPELLVIGAHGRAFLTGSQLGGFTQDILRTPPCDVLVVRC